jgi:pantothenate kinase type III
MILPGLGLMASSLARNTAQLPQIAGKTVSCRMVSPTTRTMPS